jgi:hypothetical protein
MAFNFALERVFTVAFLLGAPCLLVARLLLPRMAEWWRVVLFAAIWGWITADLAIHFNRLWLDQFDSLLAPNELADPVTSIGPYIFAKGTGDKGVLFAWVLGLAYLVLCLLPYAFLGFLLKRTRAPVRAAQIFLVVLLFSFAAALGLSHLYALYEEEKFPDLALSHLMNAAAFFGAMLCWLCVLCVVTSTFLSVVSIRRKQILGVLFIGCSAIMGLLTLHFL